MAQVIVPITKAPFQSRQLLVQSFTHSSFLPRHILMEGAGRGSYASLAFLGDAVISLHARELVLDELNRKSPKSRPLSLDVMNICYHAMVSNEGLTTVRSGLPAVYPR